jgi:hypothetical protein
LYTVEIILNGNNTMSTKAKKKVNEGGMTYATVAHSFVSKKVTSQVVTYTLPPKKPIKSNKKK